MRTDVKIGLVLSLAVVILAGWYFMQRGQEGSAIPISGGEQLASNSELDRLGGFDDRQPAALDSALDGSMPASGAPEDQVAAFTGRTALTELFATAPIENQSAGEDDSDVASAAQPRPGEATGPTTAAVETHTVKPGDTLAGIARMYYGDEGLARVVTEANPPLADRSMLTVGMVLRIPDRDVALRTDVRGAALPVTENTDRQRRRHHVIPGDTLYTIALNRLRDGSRWPEIYELNKDVIGEDAGLLRVGMVLKLPQQ